MVSWQEKASLVHRLAGGFRCQKHSGRKEHNEESREQADGAGSVGFGRGLNSFNELHDVLAMTFHGGLLRLR